MTIEERAELIERGYRLRNGAWVPGGAGRTRPPLRTITGADLGEQLNVLRPQAEAPAGAPFDLGPWYGNQPRRSFWTSSLWLRDSGAGSDWTDYCREKEPRWLSNVWRVQVARHPSVPLLEITCLDDLTAIIDAFPAIGVSDVRREAEVMDFAAIAAAGYAGVHLSAGAVWDCCLPGRYGDWSDATTRLRYQQDQVRPCCALASWECESTCWLRDDALLHLRHEPLPSWWLGFQRRNAAAVLAEFTEQIPSISPAIGQETLSGAVVRVARAGDPMETMETEDTADTADLGPADGATIYHRDLKTITGATLGPQLHVDRPRQEVPGDAPFNLSPAVGNKPLRAYWTSSLDEAPEGHPLPGPSGAWSAWTDLCREDNREWLAGPWLIQQPAPEAILLDIRGLDDLTAVIDAFPLTYEAGRAKGDGPDGWYRAINFPAIAGAGYAGVHLAQAGVWECCLAGLTRGTRPVWLGPEPRTANRYRNGATIDRPAVPYSDLSAWEVECTVWLRPHLLTTTEILPPPEWAVWDLVRVMREAVAGGKDPAVFALPDWMVDHAVGA